MPARSGTYTGVDGMGLFWSMVPPTGDPDATRFRVPPPQLQLTYDVQITVTAHGRRPAARTLNREWLAAGVTDRALTLAADKVDGDLFLPPPGRGRHPAVLLFGGSEGGNSGDYDAALLTSHGYPALSLAYFHDPGLGALGPRGNAWTWHGRPLPQDVIPLDHVNGPVLAIAGAQDRLWPMASDWARQIVAELDLDHDRFPHQALTYPGAGHGVGTFPYLPAGVRATNAVISKVLQLGGTRAGHRPLHHR